MAVNFSHIYVLILFVHNFISKAAVERRFSDFKRCADEECSMLLCRGKATTDFTGPDCRFLSFKEGETIYVYYKLSGKRTDVWAGSVGSRFGYFPQDLLTINHIYTEKEIEIPAEETDFVCFDTGHDKFDNYNIDSLLDTSLLLMGMDSVEEPSPELTHVTNDQIDSDVSEDVYEDKVTEEEVPGVKDPSDFEPSDSSLPQLETQTETLDTKQVESDTGAEPTADGTKVDLRKDQQRTGGSILNHVDSEQGEDTPSKPQGEPPSRNDADLEKEGPVFSQGRPIPELKTTLGTTFDAVTSDDTDTWRVTPYEEEEGEEEEGEEEGGEELEDQLDDSEDQRVPPLLSYSEESSILEHEDVPESNQPDGEQNPSASEDKNMWSSLGDKVFAIVSGGERTAVSSSEEEDDDDEEEIASEMPHIEEQKENVQLLTTDPEEEPEETVQLLGTDPEEEEELEEPVQLLGIDPEEEEPEENVQLLTTDLEEEDPEENVQLLATDPQEEEPEENVQLLATDPQEEEPEENVQLLAIDPQEEAEDTEQSESDFSEDAGINTQPSIQPAEEERSFEQTEEAVAENLTARDDSPVHKKPNLEPSKPEIPFNFENNVNESEDKQATEELPTEGETSGDSEHEVKHDIDKFQRFREYLITDSMNRTMHKDSKKELALQEDELVDSTEEENEEELLEDENAAFSLGTEHSDDKTGMDVNVGPIEAESEFESEPMINDTETEIETEKDAESIGSDLNHTPSLEEKNQDPLSSQEPEFSDDVMRLTLLRDHFKEQDMERFQKFLGLRNLFKVEAMFSGLEQELRAARLSQTDTSEDIEKALEGILEASETPLLDEIERMLDAREVKNTDLPQTDIVKFDEEAVILDDFQELTFHLRQKYSAASDSAPLASETHTDSDGDMPEVMEEDKTLPHSVEDTDIDDLTVPEKDGETKAPEEELDAGHKGPDMGIEEDGGHFNRNKDNQPSFKDPEEIQRGPQTILENTLDMGLSVKMEHTSSRSLESPPVPDFSEDEESGSTFPVVLLYLGSLLVLIHDFCGEYTVVMVSHLPEEWKPAPNFYGLPWEPVVTTAVLGVLTFLIFFWRSILTIKRKEYILTEKQMDEKVEEINREKVKVLSKIAELEKRGEELQEKQIQSQETATSALQKIQELENLVIEVEARHEQMAEERNALSTVLDEERSKTQKQNDLISDMEKTIEKLKRSRKKTQEALAKTTVLMDEAKLCEDARTAQHQSLEKDYAALREENNSLQNAAKAWEDRHRELSEQIKVYQKSQKDLEDSVAQKAHNIEVLSDLLADLEACDDLQKGETKVVANGEDTNDKTTAIRNRIKQMMDVSRVQTTLSVVEEERDRFMGKLLNEEKARKALEEQYQALEHDITSMKSEKSHIENQFRTLQQKNEIMTEMYQQKENALQQKLTKEEFERRNKETKLFEVDGKALQAEEEVKICRQRIREIEDELKQTERSFRSQITEQEQKAHDNWVIARAAERTLLEEKRESSNLREKLTEVTAKLNDLRRPLFKPTPGHPMPLRRGDSYGPSPVSGGAPSPPPMIEGPGRPPSAPVGRRNDPFGPRPPSDPHGRYSDHKHPIPARPDMLPPRTSSPNNMDGSLEKESQAEAEPEAVASTESPEANSRPQGPGSFVVSPIRDSAAPGPHGPLGHPPHASGLLYRPPAHMAGPHHPPPPNGHPAMPIVERFGPPPPNGHPAMFDQRFRPLPPHHGAPPPHHFGPVPPQYVVRGPAGPMRDGRPMGPRPTFHPDMRFHGPRDQSFPPQHLPTGVQMLPQYVNQQAGQAPHDSSLGLHPSSGQGQNCTPQQTAAPQDSVSSSMTEP